MSDSQAKPDLRFEISPKQEQDRRTTIRTDTTLGKIEDATYAILRKYEKKSA